MTSLRGPGLLLLLSILAPQAGVAQPVASEPEAIAPAVVEEAAPAAPEVSGPTRIALYDFVLDGVEPRIGQLVTESTLVELRKLERVSVIGMQEIRDMLDHESARQMAGCDADDSCLADIAGALGVDVLVTGGLARVGDEHILSLRRMDQRRAKVVGSVSRRLTAEDGEEFLAAIGPAVAELFPDVTLREGRKRGVDEEVALRLNPPPVPTWAFWSVAGVSATVLASGLALGGANLLVVAQFNGRIEEAKDQPVDYQRVQPLMTLANVTAVGAWALVLGGVALGAGAGVMTPFVDWKGYGDAAE